MWLYNPYRIKVSKGGEDWHNFAGAFSRHHVHQLCKEKA